MSQPSLMSNSELERMEQEDWHLCKENCADKIVQRLLFSKTNYAREKSKRDGSVRHVKRFGVIKKKQLRNRQVAFRSPTLSLSLFLDLFSLSQTSCSIFSCPPMSTLPHMKLKQETKLRSKHVNAHII